MKQKEYINVDELFQNWHDKPANQPSDMAWSKMHDILEKEMPQKEKRKKKWFIPFLGLICTIGGAGIGIAASTYYFNSNNSASEINTANSDIIALQGAKSNGMQTNHATTNQHDINAYSDQEAEKVLAHLAKNGQHKPSTTLNQNTVAFKSKQHNRPSKQSRASYNTPSQLNAVVQNAADAKAIATIVNEYEKNHNDIAINDNQQQGFKTEKNKQITLQHDLVNSSVLVASAYIKSPVGLEYIKYNNTWFKKINAPKTFKVQYKKYENTNDIASLESDATIITNSLAPLALDVNNGGASEINDHASENEVTASNNITTKLNQMNTFWEDLQIRSSPFASWLFSSHSFNPIINAGMHYSSAFSGAMGYNLGFGVKYNLKQHIKISTLLNYQHTFLGNYIYNDHALQYNVTKNGNTYSGEEITEENYYTLKSIQQVQIPIYLNYHFVKDFYLTAGINMSYTLPVNYNTDSYKKINDNFASLVEPQAQAANIKSSRDFNQNIGVGYILGFGYNANKRMQIDLKMQQMLYNSNIQESYLGKDLYGKPTFNLQITYNLGKK